MDKSEGNGSGTQPNSSQRPWALPIRLEWPVLPSSLVSMSLSYMLGARKARYEASRSETEKSLAIENAKLKRQVAKQAEELALLKKAAAYFAKGLK